MELAIVDFFFPPTSEAVSPPIDETSSSCSWSISIVGSEADDADEAFSKSTSTLFPEVSSSSASSLSPSFAVRSMDSRRLVSVSSRDEDEADNNAPRLALSILLPEDKNPERCFANASPILICDASSAAAAVAEMSSSFMGCCFRGFGEDVSGFSTPGQGSLYISTIMFPVSFTISSDFVDTRLPVAWADVDKFESAVRISPS
mmetsp:Transcript_42508/g.102388  ORF Transcript_42508/g.102388 Transcript_42508/m.102388 type:complete len:203 (+) Transcript_42508:1146-1754(+)